MTTTQVGPSAAMLATLAAIARDQRRTDRKIARIHAEHERRRAHEARTRQLGKAVAAMANRRCSSERAHARASVNPAGTWAGKTHEQWNRATIRQHEAMLRLLYALEDHANGPVQPRR